MNLLQILLIISAIIILILATDIAKKQKFNALHFLVFLWMWWWLLVFTFFPNFLNSFGQFFGLQRGADLLVYASVIFLVYFVLLLLSKHVENKDNITGLIRELAIENSDKKIIKWKEVFLIRVFNEEKVLENTINKIIDKNYKNILVINDWSTDNSKNILENFWDKIILINHLKNRGWWAALKTGFEYLKRFWKTEFIITFDADWQHDLKNLDNFFTEFEKDNSLDVILWSRFIEKTDTNVPFIRKLILFWWKFFTYFLSNIYLTDSHNWYRVLKTKILDKINISMDWMEYASELVESINKNNLKFKEVPVDIKYSKYSISKGQSNWNAIKIAVRFIWNKIFR